MLSALSIIYAPLNLKTPMYLVAAGFIIIFLVASTSSLCDVFGIDLTEESCDSNGVPAGEQHILTSIFFYVGLTGIFMVLIGVTWTINSYFFG